MAAKCNPIGMSGVLRVCRILDVSYWTPQRLYDAKPWLFVGVGAALAIGMMLWSLYSGLWTLWRSLLCLAGAALAIVGGATVQMRQEYRARSKWRREKGP